MRIGIDVDDVLCDSFEFFIPHINEKYNLNLTLEDFFSWNLVKALEEHDIPHEEAYKEFLEFITKNVLEFSFDKDAKDIILKLSQSYELFIITGRDPRNKEGTIKWIEENLGKDTIEEVICVKELGISKLDYCIQNNIKTLIEDGPSDIERFIEKRVPIIIMDKPWNREYEGENVYRVKSWLEFEEILENLV